MIDSFKAIRQAFFDALEEEISVPVYNEYNPNDEPMYVLLSTQTSNDNSNKGRFVTSGTLLVDIIVKSTDFSYDQVDEIAGEIMTIIQPTINTTGLINPTGLQITKLRLLSSNNLSFIDADENVLRRLLRYEFSTVEI